jgi:hypothetical protein
MNRLKTFFSKKLFVAVGTAVLLVINRQLPIPLDESTIKDIVLVVTAYLFGQSAVDIIALKTPTAPNPPSVGELEQPPPPDYNTQPPTCG